MIMAKTSFNPFAILVLCLSFALLTTITFADNLSLLQQYCPTKPVPQKNRSTKMIFDYLQRYAESDCDIYDNIYIIWNNEETPEQMGVLENSHKWKKNVYFMPTIENSLDFKYIVPTWAAQKVFFGMDDDFDITCETFKTAFSSWQDSSHGEVGPLASFYARSYVFDYQTQSFTYIDQVKLNQKWNYYHFGLTGIAFISRHFLELYYSDIFQLKQMRKMVVEKRNCQDLLMNFLVGYLYPELVTEYLKVPFRSLGTTGVSTTKSHNQFRAECINRFTDILGFNPIRFVESKKNEDLMSKKTSINQNCLVNLKQEHFEKNFITNRAYYMYIKRIVVGNQSQKDFAAKENEKLDEAKKNIEKFMKEKKEEMAKLKINEKTEVRVQQGLSEKDRKMLQETQMNLHFGTEQQIEAYMAKIQQKNPEKVPEQTQIKLQTNSKPQPVQESRIQKVSQQETFLHSQEFQYQLYGIILACIFLSILCIRKILNQKNKKYQIVPESISTQL